MSNKLYSTIPLLPATIIKYTTGNAAGLDYYIELDLKNVKLSMNHLFNYISHLKIDCEFLNIDKEFFIEYIRTPYMIGNSNMIKYYMNALYYTKYRRLYFEDLELKLDYSEFILTDHIRLLESLPLFLLNHIENSDKINKFNHTSEILDIGINFVHIIKYDSFLIELLNDSIFDISLMKYYNHYFDKSIYDGHKLIKYFMNNPKNLMNKIPEYITI